MDSEKARADLLREMKQTKGSRSNSAKRLENRDRRMTVVTAFASAYVIALTVAPSFLQSDAHAVRIFNAATVLLSLVIRAASLLQYSTNAPVRAEQHHRCALEINGLRRELRASISPSHEDMLEFGRRYDAILGRFSVNHDDVDFERYKLEHPDEFGREMHLARRLWLGMKFFAIGHWTQVAVILMTGVVLWLLFVHG